MKIPDAEIDAILEHHPVARLAVRAGREGVFQVPVVFARSGGRLWSPVDAKPKAGGELARARHIRAHPRVSLLLDHYDDDWSQLWWLRVEGEAEIVQGSTASDERAVAAVRALKVKYPQYDHTAVLREPATLIAIRPQRLVSWRAGD